MPEETDHTHTSDETVNSRLREADDIVQRNIYWAMGAGLLPFPVFDLVAVTTVQLKQMRQLSVLYDVPFREGIARKAVLSLLVGVGGLSIGGIIGVSLFRFVPVIGQALGTVSVPVVSGMLTRAIGRTYVMHLEAGGTLLDFDAKQMREYFRQEYGRAREVVENMHTNEEPAATPA